MRVRFLGTGTSSGIPLVGCKCAVCQSTNPKDKRLRTSVLVEVNGLNIVIDTGPDFRQQMLREHIDRLDAVLFTHSHRDHTGGLDDIRAYNFIMKRDMNLYLTEFTASQLKIHYDYVFAENPYPGIPRVRLNIIDNKPFDIQGTTITPIQVLHHKMPVLAFRIEDFTYITDANYIAESEKEKIKGSRVMVINALRREDHISHFTLSQALDLIAELEVEQAYLIHMSHQLGLHNDVERELPEGVHLSFDGLHLDI